MDSHIDRIERAKDEYARDHGIPRVPTWDNMEIEEAPKRVSTESARKAYGATPDGFQIHHLCENPWCRNPDHLIAVSEADHRKIHGRRSYCAR